MVLTLLHYFPRHRPSTKMNVFLYFSFFLLNPSMRIIAAASERNPGKLQAPFAHLGPLFPVGAQCAIHNTTINIGIGTTRTTHQNGRAWDIRCWRREWACWNTRARRYVYSVDVFSLFWVCKRKGREMTAALPDAIVGALHNRFAGILDFLFLFLKKVK